jgi:hypothetical protein
MSIINDKDYPRKGGQKFMGESKNAPSYIGKKRAPEYVQITNAKDYNEGSASVTKVDGHKRKTITLGYSGSIKKDSPKSGGYVQNTCTSDYMKSGGRTKFSAESKGPEVRRMPKSL